MERAGAGCLGSGRAPALAGRVTSGGPGCASAASALMASASGGDSPGHRGSAVDTACCSRHSGAEAEGQDQQLDRPAFKNHSRL